MCQPPPWYSVRIRGHVLRKTWRAPSSSLGCVARQGGGAHLLPGVAVLVPGGPPPCATRCRCCAAKARQGRHAAQHSPETAPVRLPDPPPATAERGARPAGIPAAQHRSDAAQHGAAPCRRSARSHRPCVGPGSGVGGGAEAIGRKLCHALSGGSPRHRIPLHLFRNILGGSLRRRRGAREPPCNAWAGRDAGPARPGRYPERRVGPAWCRAGAGRGA